MTSDFLQRQVARLLSQAEADLDRSDWASVRQRAQDILRLDPGNSDAQALLQAASRDAAESSTSTRDAVAPPVSAPQPTAFVSGRYEVKRFLGEGGKKKVYLAHDATLDRDVAFALIKAEGLDDAGRERVTREAQAMARLGDHPNVVSVYDLGMEGGRPYMVLPLLPGGDIEGLIEKAPEHRLPIEHVLQVGIEVCHGLEFAHEKGIVHRDLKPGNVWLAEDGRAKIGDFGLAVAIDRSRLTQAGMMVGTVSYMPPEQAMGGEVGPRSDLYSLGCMLYEMVCGRPPFVGDESVAIIGQHLNTPPVTPTWHRPDCPTGLEAIILRLLEKDASKRPASAAEVRQALQAVSTTPREPSIEQSVESPHEHDPLYGRTFVGRETELRALEAAFDSALSGQGSLAMVVGEPGIGKTALCEQLATYVAMRGGRALVGHCYEEGSLSLPYLAFVEAMRSYVLAREPDGLKSDLGTGAADVARIISEVRDRVQGVELRDAGDPEDDRWRLLQAVTSFLRNASTVQPLVIVLEDLHWADRGTFDLLLHVARNLQGARLMLVGTYRDVEVDRSHPLSGILADLRRIAGFQRVPLRGLTVDEVQRMMTNIRGQEATTTAAEAIHRQTEGNPLFIQEVLRYIVEAGLLTREGGRYVRTDDRPPEAIIPEGLRDVIGKRLSRLSSECNRLLAIAGVIGRDFDLATLRAVSGVEEDALLSAIEEAVRVGVLEERSQPGRVLYRFAHAFFRQTLYEEMIAPRRLRLHQEVARALEAQYGARREDHAAELAEHYAQSTDRADLAKAVEYGELAAQRAMSVYAYAEAASHLERSLAVQEVLDPDDSAKRCDLLLALGEAALLVGETRKVIDELAPRIFDLADSVIDSRRAFAASILAVDAFRLYGAATTNRSPAFRLWAERADKYASPGTGERVRADLALARLSISEARADEERELKIRALSLARELGQPALILMAMQAFVGNPQAPQRWQERLGLATEVSQLPTTGVNSANLAGALHFAGAILLSNGDRGRAEEVWSRVRLLSEQRYVPIATLFVQIAGIQLATIDGQLDEAMDFRANLIAKADELGSPIFGRQFAALAGSRALFLLGRSEELAENVRELDEMAQLESFASRNWRYLALAHSGRLAEAAIGLQTIVEERGLAETPNETSQTVVVLALELALLCRLPHEISILAPRLEENRLLIDGGHLVSIARLLGLASTILGKPDDARGYYDQALEVCAKIRFRPEIALTRLELAELLLGHYPDERATAIEHLDFAIGEFREMKLQPSLERALRHRGLLKA